VIVDRFIDIGIFVTDSYFEYCVLGLLLLSSYTYCFMAILCTSCLIVLDLYCIVSVCIGRDLTCRWRIVKGQIEML